MAYEAYEVWLTTDYGKRIALLTSFLELQYTLITNDVGQCSIVLPSTFDTSLLVKDYTIQIWRAPLGTSKMSLQQLYILDYWDYAVSNGSLTIVVRASSVKCLLERRVVAQYSGTSGAAKLDYADDMQRELVNENIIGPIDTDRTMDFIIIESTEQSAGPILQLRMSYKNLLAVLKEISEASRAAETEVFFDLHPTATSAAFTCEFRTKTGQPGSDVTDLGVLFSEEMGNLEEAFLEFDWRKEKNVVYAMGQGSGVAQDIQEVEDTVRSGASRYARNEGTVSAGSQQEPDEVTAVGQTALDLGRPFRRFGGKLKDTRGSRYGVDWWFGDKVTARFLEQEFDAIVRSVGIRVTADGKEEIDARAEYEGD